MKRGRSLGAVLATTAVLAACGSSHHAAKREQSLPKDRLIVLGTSIGPISLDESRSAVQKGFGPGKRSSRGVFLYFGGRLLVSYWLHDGLTDRVQFIKTTWVGFHTDSGLHVGTSRRDYFLPPGSCSGHECGLAAGKMPDAPGTLLGLRDGKFAWIAVGYS